MAGYLASGFDFCTMRIIPVIGIGIVDGENPE
jgi:hypothetical protein